MKSLLFVEEKFVLFLLDTRTAIDEMCSIYVQNVHSFAMVPFSSPMIWQMARRMNFEKRRKFEKFLI